MNEERSRGKYTLEFKQEAVRQVKAGRAASVKAIPPERALTILCAILQSDHRQSLPLPKRPARILQTQRDSLVPLPVAEYMARTLPHAELRLLDAQGHLPHLTAPDQVAAALRAFLH